MAKKNLRHSERQLISLREISDLWHCDRTTVARILMKAGIKPYQLTKKRNGTKRFWKKEVDAYLTSCREKKSVAGILE